MPYSYTNENTGKSYILHSKETELKNGKKQVIYYFAKDARENALDAVPAGYEVSLTKNGLPVLKKQK